MKILFLTDNFPPEVNASASRVFERAKYWAAWGHQVTVITSFPNFPEGRIFPGYKNKPYQIEIIDGIKVIRVKTLIIANTGFALRILDFLSYMISSCIAGLLQEKPDVVIATSPQLFTAVSGWIVSRFKACKFIFELGDIWPASISAVGAMKQSFAFRLLEKLELFLYRRADSIIALTDAFKKNLTQRGIPAKKIQVVINGVELKQYAPTARDMSLAKQYNLENAFVIGYIGTHGMAHDLKNVLAAAEQLLPEKNIQFIFVGAGAERDTLIKTAEQKQLSNVQFIPMQPKEKINTYWSLCNIALVHLKNDAVFSEVIPSKIFEAMAMGLPVLLASPAGEASAIINEEKNGVWIPAQNPAALANAILALYQQPSTLQQFAANSLVAAPKYSREIQAKKMLTAISQPISF